MITRKMKAVIARSQNAVAKFMNVPIQVELAWDPDTDPLAVMAIFSLPGDQTASGEDEEIVWVFGRDLLTAGLQSLAPTGLGDVRFRLASVARVNLITCLKSPEGHADVLLPVIDVETFLGETFQHTPLGAEVTDDLVDEFLKEFEQ